MFCISCGTRLPDDAAYCSACGRATYRPDAPAPVAEARAAETPSSPLTTAEGPAPSPTATAPSPRTTAGRWSEAVGVPYLYDGRWWSRGLGGEVLIWDEERNNWDLALSSQTPFFMRRPRFAPLKAPATWIYVLIGAFGLFTLLAIAADVQQVYIGSEVDGGREFTTTELEDATAVSEAMRGLQVLALLGIAPLLLWWTYRATSNLAALGAESLEISPRWSVGWWLIPFANFVQPARVLNQLWRATDPSLPARPGQEWRSSSEDLLTVAWWPVCVALYFAWNIVVYQWDSQDLADPARGAWAGGLIAVDAALAGAAALGIVVVRRLTRRQQLANVRFDPPSTQAASAASGALVQPTW